MYDLRAMANNALDNQSGSWDDYSQAIKIKPDLSSLGRGV